jgi:putative acetyltransferase
MRATQDYGVLPLIVELTCKLAQRDDAERLLELRRRSIMMLAPSGMPAADAATWAATLTVSGMESKIRELEVWLAMVGTAIVAWGAIHGDRLEGLYVDPEWAGRGIGTQLLLRLEARMREQGVAEIVADASLNAEAFYCRRGYVAFGLRTGNGAQPIRKRLG